MLNMFSVLSVVINKDFSNDSTKSNTQKLQNFSRYTIKQIQIYLHKHLKNKELFKY